MLDFNTKKQIIRSLREKRCKNKAMWLICVIAEFAVKLWYAVACRVDMALSDKNGNFLGLKREKNKSKSHKKDDIVYVKRPIVSRIVSGILAASFLIMMVPELGVLDFSVFADIVEVGTSSIQDDEGKRYTYKPEESNMEANYLLYYKNEEYDAASSQITVNIGYYVGNGAIRVEYQEPDLRQYVTATGEQAIKISGYTVYLIEAGTGQIIDQKNATTTGSYVDFTGKSTNVNYYVRVEPIFKVLLYQYIKAWQDVTTGDILPATIVPTDKYFELKGKSTDSESKTIMLNARMDPPQVFKLSNDENVLRWNEVTQIEGDTKDIGKIPDGYVIFRSTVDGTTGASSSFKQIGIVPYNQYLTDSIADELGVENPDGINTLYYVDSTVVLGAIYDYYVMAYRRATGSSDYSATNPFTITSGGESAHVKRRLYTTPTSPKDLKVTSDKKSKLTLKWSAGKGQNNGYEIFRSETPLTYEMMESYTPEGGNITQNPYYNAELGKLDFYEFISANSQFVESVGTGTLTCVDDDERLVNTTVYHYYVFAYLAREDMDSLYSEPTTASGSIGASLYAPQGFTATPGDGQVTLKWDAVTGADGYRIYITKIADTDGNPIANPTEVIVDDITKTTYTHLGLLNGEKYTYYIRAYINAKSNADPNVEDNDVVLSNPSDKRTVTVGELIGIPQDLKLTTKDGQVTVSWSKVNGAEGYILYYQKEGDRTWQQIDLTKTSFNHTRLNNGDVYKYKVQAYKTVNGERDYGEESVIVSITVGDKLDTPRDFKATTTDGKVSLSWSKSTGAEGYILYAYSGGQRYEFDVSKLKYEHTGLNNGDIWTYYLVAYKTVNGERSFSDPTESITVTIGISLNSAVDLVAKPGNHQIELSWSKVTGAEGYVVYLYNEKTMEFEAITVTSKTKYTHVGLKNGKEYTYMVAAYKNINGERYYGEYSMAVSATPTSGSTTDIDRTLNIKGTTPYGISHSEYISAKANHDAFEESVDVYFTTNRESTAAVRDVLKNYANGLSSFIIYPFDISIYKENTLIEVIPNDGYSVTVTMPIPDKLIAYRDYLTVVHINEEAGAESGDENAWYEIGDQRLEVLPCAILDLDNVWCVQFVCSSFSPYAFVIYKDHINDASSGGGIAMDGDFAGSFNSGVLLFTVLPDIMPNNRKLKVVNGKKRYHIKSITKK